MYIDRQIDHNMKKPTNSAVMKDLGAMTLYKLFPSRASKKRVELIPEQEEPRLVFSENASLIEYDADLVKKTDVQKIEDVVLHDPRMLTWFNVYGLNHPVQFSKIIEHNKLDSFLIHLIADDNHRTKVVSLRNCSFFTAKSIYFSDGINVKLEQVIFIISPDFVWSIQEKKGDNFDHIRERLDRNVGRVRERGTDYLLFLILESIVDTYYQAYEDLTKDTTQLVDFNWSQADLSILQQIEARKTNLFRMRKTLFNLKEAISQLISLEDSMVKEESMKYFVELREQAGYLIDQIDNDMHRMESATNLFFSLQSHRLNQVMKTLTILSAIFIPLTFLAGVYGMNFQHMPELGYKYGYYILLGFMLLIAAGSFIYFKKKRWF